MRAIRSVLLAALVAASSLAHAASGYGTPSFVQSGTGAVGRAFVDKARETFSVKDFGAKGDDTTDDAAAFQAALDAANAAGGARVFLPRATYRIASGLTLYNDVAVEGDGDASVIDMDGSFDLFTLTGTVGTRKTGVALRNFKITKASGTGNFVVWTLVSRPCSIENLSLVGTGLAANAYIKLAGTTGCEVVNVHGKDNAQIALTSSDGTTGGTWGLRNTITGGDFYGGSQGLTVLYQEGARFIGTRSGGSTGEFGVGFDIEYENRDLSFIGTEAYENANWAGYYIEGNVANGVHDVEFVGAVARNNGTNGFDLNANFTNIRMVGGSSYDNSVGISTAGSSHVHVTGMDIRSNTSHGISASSLYLSSIVGNSFNNNGGWGISLTGSPSGNTIDGNSFDGNTSGTITGGEQTPIAGTWTPTLTGSSGGSFTLGNAYGYYTKIGDMVYGHLYIANGTDNAMSGNWRVSLPVAASSSTGAQMVAPVGYSRGLPTSANATGYSLAGVAGQSYADVMFTYNDGSETQNVNINPPAANVIISADFAYKAAN